MTVTCESGYWLSTDITQNQYDIVCENGDEARIVICGKSSVSIKMFKKYFIENKK